MRVSLAPLLSLALTLPVSSQDLTERPPVPWQLPFEPIAAAEPSRLAVIIAITNDDPFRSADVDRASAAERLQGNQAPAPQLWCRREMETSFRRLQAIRPELAEHLSLQGLAVGLPQELTGGEPRNDPSRSLIALCDSEYRLLGIHIGVPGGDDLISMVEDAEDVAVARQLRAESGLRDAINELIVQRSEERLDRTWQNVFGQYRDNIRAKEARFDALGEPSQLRAIFEAFEAVYLEDVRRRFAVNDVSDRQRLGVLEQHLETRQAWSDALIPFLEGQDFSLLWRSVVSWVWQMPPVTSQGNDDQLLTWIDDQLESSAVVLAIDPHADDQRFAWPSLDDSASRRVERWRELHQLALQHPFRTVTIEQLAWVIRHRKLKPIDVQRPSMARYALIEPGRDRPMVIGERDPPARFANRLKRVGSDRFRSPASTSPDGAESPDSVEPRQQNTPAGSKR